ncbi:MAG: Ig-like domain-containing protein, partial [Pseudomonadota bacterium]
MPTNTAPTGISDVFIVTLNSQNNPVNVLANDTDADGDVLHITTVSITQSLPPSSGAIASVATDGLTLRYTPPAQFIGQQVLLYTLSDGRGGSTQAVALITTSALPVPPVAVPDVFTLLGDGAVTSLAVLGNDIDGAGGGLTVIAAQSDLTVPTGNAGSVSVVDGALHYQPRAGFVGVETLSYTLRDANGATATAVALVTVLPLAAPPVALPDVASTAINTPVLVPVLDNDVDLAGGGLTLASVTPLLSVPAGNNGSLSILGNSLRFVPVSPTFVGVQTASYTVRDANGGTATGLVTLTVTPALPLLPPVALPDVAVITGNSSNAVLVVRDNDVDASGGGLSISAASVVAAVPATASSVVTTDGSVLRLTPPTGFAGVLTLSYTVTDSNGQTSSAPVIVTVTPALLPAVPPVALPDVAVVTQDSTSNLIDVVSNDLDLAGGGLSLSSVSSVSSLPVATHSAVISGNQLAFTPASGFAGAVTLSYTVLDSQGQSATGLVNVVVTPALLALGPVALPDVAMVAQNSAASSIDLLLNDLDPAAGGLTLSTVTMVSSLPLATHGISISGNQLAFTPASGFAGAVVLSYTATDSQGQSASGLVNIVVTPALLSLGPVALPDVAVVAQDSSANAIDVLGNDLDLAGNGLTLSTATLVSSLPIATQGIAINGNQLAFTPASGFAGAVVLSYTATDSQGQSSTGLVNIVVSPSTLALGPVALPDAALLTQDSSANSINVSANDIDVAGAGLTVTAASVLTSLPVASHSISVVGNAVQFTPAATFSGLVTLSYTVRDANGRTASGVVAITVTPTPLSLGPVALPDVAMVTQDGTASSIDVLVNDLDAAGGGLTLSSVSMVSSLPLATHGISISGNQLAFTPASGFAGAVVLSYTATDSQGQSATGLVNIVVTPALLALSPVALPDVAVLAQDSSANSIDVLVNDVDPVGGGLMLMTATLISSLPSATQGIAISGNQLAFTPASGFAGAVVLSYTATDSQGQSSTGLVNIVVSPSTLALGPVALPDAALLTQDSSANSINVSANDIDVAGAGLTVTAASVLTSLPVASHSISVVGNAVQFTPAATFSGLVTLSYTVRD